MSTLQPKSIAKTTLPHFKSTNTIHPRNKLTPTKHKSQHSAFLTPLQKYPSDQDSGYLSKTLLQTNLPDIHSKKSVQKRSSIMQMWLDQALDPQDKHISSQNPPLRIDVDKTGPLKTVQKFQIDKKYLKSQNMSPETIDKIYNSLYVYTYGINHTFKEILTLTKMSQHTQKKIIDNFWKTYIRLLQGCTSFQTTFQIIEEGHLKARTQLKNVFIKREQEWQKERAALEQQKIKLMKKIGEITLTLAKLTADYNISQTTLHLTDKAFNDEVNIRLMFEQKVNAMFNSYDELRYKYDELLQTLRIKERDEQQEKKREEQLRHDNKILHIRNQDLQKQLNRAQEHIIERDRELTLKRQEIFQLNNIKHQLMQEKESEEEQIRKIVCKIDHFKHLSEQYKSQSKSKGIIMQELQKRVDQQDKALQTNLQIQNKLYQQLKENSELISTLKKTEIEFGYQIKEIKEDRNRVREITQQQSISIEKLNSIINQLQKALNETQGELTIKNSLLQKNTSLLSELQAVNGKLENMLKHVSAEKSKMETELSSSLEISERFKEQMEGMKMLLQSKTVEMQQSQTKLENQREVFRSKIAGLKEEVEVRDHKILEMHDQEIEGKEKVKEAEEQLTGYQEKQEQMKSEMLNLESEIVQLKVKLEAVQKERIKQSINLKNASERLLLSEQEMKKIKQILSVKEGLITSVQHNSKSQSEQLRVILESYREDREKKVSYIHPMLYQDATEQINRLTIKNESLFVEIKNKSEIISALQIKVEQRSDFDKQAEEKMKKATRMMVQNEQKMVILKQNQKRLSDQLQEVQSQNFNFKSQSKQKIIGLQTSLKRLKEDLTKNNKLLQEKQMFIDELKKMRQELNLNNHELKQKLEHLKQKQEKTAKQLLDIKQKNRILTSRDSEREKIIDSEPKCEKNQTEFYDREHKYVHQETQTEKKFNHSFKFQLTQNSTSFGCQVNNQDIDQIYREERGTIARDREPKKVEAQQFRRALKITYMRR